MSNRIEELVTATDAWCDQNFPPDWTERVDEFLPLWNEKFAALVAAAEREACRQACKALADAAQEEAYYRAHMECEAAIRARGET